ncbi:hypothetical protein FACS1894158_01910 [Betaproteobacteria bacterium]|nr:hypothetical protein FACS1894158_01910 [Betaproteobacteria bacterium]
MKPDTLPKRFPSTPEEWEALIAAAPETVNDPEGPYDPNDAAAVEAFWSRPEVIVSRSFEEHQEKMAARKKRGAGRRPKKEQVAIRYSPDVLAAFRATGRGWQTRMDNALREWVETHAG